MLPDLTITALLAASCDLRLVVGRSPVVPMTWTMRAFAASAAKRERGGRHREVDDAMGRVRAAASASLVTLTPLAGSPASTPASCPINGEPAPSIAPASVEPVRLGDRPDQRAPHAPAGAGDHSRMSAMAKLSGSARYSVPARQVSRHGCGPS